MLRDKGLVDHKPIGIVQSGKRQGQPTKVLYQTSDLLYIAEKGSVRGTDVGGSEMLSKWSSRDRAGRSRYQLAKGYQIVERSKDGGYSYDFICRENGNRIPKVMKMIDNRQDAIKEGYKLMVEINEKKEVATVTDGGGCPTYSEYLPAFLEYKRANAKIRHFDVIEGNVRKLEREKFGNLKLDEITQKTAEEYRDECRKTGIVCDPTISAKVGYLNQVLKRAEKDGYNTKQIDRIDLGLKSAKVRKEFMTKEQQKVMWPLLKKHQPMADLADMILGCAMRPVNIIQLKWPDIHWDDGIAFVDGSIHKNHDDGEYILFDGLIKMLKRRQDENGCSDLVFVRYECENPKPITETWIQRKWRAVKKEANKILEERKNNLRIPDSLRFYDLKATYLSREAEKGATEYDLQAIANHADPHSLKHYIRKKAMQKRVRDVRNGKREYQQE